MAATKAVSSRRLMKDVKDFTDLEKQQTEKNLDYRFRFELAKPDVLSVLNIYITQLTPNRDSALEKQMDKLGIPHFHLEYTFSDDHPYSPPFVRFITPRFIFKTGNVTLGGSICMELLTKQGWGATNSVENVLRQIILQLQLGEGVIDESSYSKAYGIAEAKEAYARMLASHGWK